MISRFISGMQRGALATVFMLSPALSFAADDPRYLQALDLARQADYPQALRMLEDLMEEQPGNQRYFLDYITVMGWAENDMQVLTLVAALPQDSLPLYVLETAGKSARNLKHYDLAEQYYRLAISKSPDRIASIQGLAMTLADSGKGNEAMRVIHEARTQMPQKTELLITQAYVLRANSDSHFEQLAVYEQILKQDPNNSEALRGRILTTHWLGASAAALNLAERNPHVLNADERFAITEQKLRNAFWAVHDSAQPEAEQTSRLQGIAAELERLSGQLSPHRKDQLQQIQIDLLSVTIFLGNIQQAGAIYANLQQPVATDPRTHIAIGQYLLSQNNETGALSHFNTALEQDPDNIEAQLGIFETLIAQNKYTEANTFIEKYYAATPVWLNNNRQTPNHNKIRLALAKTMLQSYSNHLPEAQATLAQLAAQAPENSDILSSYARVLFWRGWPEQALPIFEYAQAIEPQNFDLINETHDAAYAVRDYRKANSLYQIAAELNPQKITGSDIQRRQLRHQQYWYEVELSHTSNQGIYEDVAAFQFDARLYSPHFGNFWRAYAGDFYQRGDIDNTLVSYHRQHVGLDYTNKSLHSYADINASITSNIQPGLRLGSDYRINDQFSIAGEINTFSDDVSLRGRKDSITAWMFTASLHYRHSELTQTGVNLTRSEFSDGNERNSAFTYVRQRLISQARYLMHTQLNAYTSSNNLNNAVYFNPEQDLAVEGELLNEWLSYRSASTSMHQELNGSLGMYKQKRFSAQPTASLAYSHRWNLKNAMNINYGIRTSIPVYDGAHEKSTYLFASISGYL